LKSFKQHQTTSNNIKRHQTMSNKRRKYRLAMLDDLTLREVFHIRVSLLGAISFITISIVALIVLLSVLIVYTPLRNILPGYSASLRQQLIQESARVDSLQADLTLQRQYLDVIKQLTAGDIQSDSVQSLDSMQRVERAQILEQQRNEVTESFKEQYELKERDRLLLFDVPNRTVQQLYRPVRGVVVQSAKPDEHRYSILVRTPKNENVLAIMRGHIVLVERAEDNTFTIIIQHTPYMTVYRHVARPLKTQGALVEAGDAVGQMDGQLDLEMEIWNAGEFVNPEEAIVW
jgi:septal ring factor EnvC (AmiA/AmiB activator)